MPISFCVFDTPIGHGGIAWDARGVVGLQLPEPDAARVRARLRRHHPASVQTTPPPEVARAIADIRALLGGASVDLCSVRLNMDAVEPFERRVSDTCTVLRIPFIWVTTWWR